MTQDKSAGVRLLAEFDALYPEAASPEERIETIYRFVANYNLHKGALARYEKLTSWIGDACWAARLGRRQGFRAAILSYLWMRRLRVSSFDPAFYAMQLLGTPWTRLDPVRHYVLFGAADDFDPAPGFSTAFYQMAYDDVRRSGVNPFYHYLKYGRHEGRRIEPSDRVRAFMQALVQRSAAHEMEGDDLDIISALGSLATPAIEDNGMRAWPLRERPRHFAGFDLYDVRPDDVVISESERGATFFNSHRLLTQTPSWRTAVASLNAAGSHRTVYEKPDVSIIIPVYGQLAYTLNCLDSLLAHSSRYSFEVIVGDDASPDESEHWLRQLEGIVYRRSDVNGGFIANCNQSAGLAKGRYIVFLNNDTRICSEWLDQLIGTFEQFAGAGLAGSKLFYPDGSLQEAGGIVWQDGSAWNYGRNDDPNRPRYCYAREVDYISGAAIAVESDVWRNLGGFDTFYSPAYYEDTDLAFRVRQAGLKVVMQPRSRVIHYEGKTSGVDTASGAKAYQLINHQKFYERWAQSLKSHRPNGEKPWLEKERNRSRRVLIVDASTPTWGTDAGSAATINLIRQYQALGFKVSFVPEDNFLFQSQATGFLQGMGVECLYAPYETTMSGILKRYGSLLDVVHLIRPAVAAKTIDRVRRFAPEARVVYLNADLHYLRMERQAAIEGNSDLQAQAMEMKTREIELAQKVDVNLVHSTVEEALLSIEGVAASRIVYYPLIETAKIAPAKAKGRGDIMFLGGYNHPPNLDAAEWLCDMIWPLLATKLPQARLLLVGANPPSALLARASDRVIVTGVVDDLAPWFERTRVFIAPLRYGAGAKGKVLAALAHGVPVVATDIAAEGMPLQPGKDIHIANSTESLVEETLRIYGLGKAPWENASRACQAYVDAGHRFAVGLGALSKALNAAGLPVEARDHVRPI